MKTLNNVLSEKAKAKIADDCVRLCKAVLSTLFSEMARAFNNYARDINYPVDCYEETTKEDVSE